MMENSPEKIKFSIWKKIESLGVYVRKGVINGTTSGEVYNRFAYEINGDSNLDESSDKEKVLPNDGRYPSDFIGQEAQLHRKAINYKGGNTFYQFYTGYNKDFYFYIDDIRACVRVADHPFVMETWIRENADCLLGISFVAGDMDVNYGLGYKEWISHDTDAKNLMDEKVTVWEYVVGKTNLYKTSYLRRIASTIASFVGHSPYRNMRYGFYNEQKERLILPYVKGEPIYGILPTERTNYPNGLNEDMDSMLGEDPMVAQQNIEQARKKMDREVERKFPQYWEAERYYKPAYQKIWDGRGSYEGKDDEIIHEAVGKFAEKLGLKWDWIRDPYYLFGFYPANANKNDMQIKVPYDFKFTHVHTKCIQWFRNQVKQATDGSVKKKGIRLCESRKPTKPKYPQDDESLYTWLMELYDETIRRGDNTKNILWPSKKFLQEMFRKSPTVSIVIAELYKEQQDSLNIIRNTQFCPFDEKFRNEAMQFIGMAEYRKPISYAVYLQVSQWDVEGDENLSFLKDKKNGFLYRIVPIEDLTKVYSADKYGPFVRSLMEEFFSFFVKATHGKDEVRNYLLGGEFFKRVQYIGTCWYDG